MVIRSRTGGASLAVKTWPSNADSTPGWGLRCPMPCIQKNQNIKETQCCNKLNETQCCNKLNRLCKWPT